MYAGETEPGQDTLPRRNLRHRVVSVTFRSALCAYDKVFRAHQRTVFPRVTTAQETPERSDARQPPSGFLVVPVRSVVSSSEIFMMSTEGMMLRICSMASWGLFPQKCAVTGIIGNQDTVFRLINRIQRCDFCRPVGERQRAAVKRFWSASGRFPTLPPCGA